MMINMMLAKKLNATGRSSLSDLWKSTMTDRTKPYFLKYFKTL